MGKFHSGGGLGNSLCNSLALSRTYDVRSGRADVRRTQSQWADSLMDIAYAVAVAKYTEERW